uniref:Uncharacterized protein n=1 Tax=Anguilla anguilla TaxID=7936 RepID=A0A0E9WJ07_ANGAN
MIMTVHTNYFHSAFDIYITLVQPKYLEGNHLSDKIQFLGVNIDIFI